MTFARLSIVGVLLLLGVGPLAGQSFRGTGNQATPAFPLVAGVAVFEVQHRGTGPFRMRLLDEHGALVDSVAWGTGAFGGSKAVAIAAAGRYLLNVEASGAWSVRVRTGEAALEPLVDPTLDSVMSAGRAAGREAGGRPGTSAHLVRGFFGGLLLGPVGVAIATSAADNRADDDAIQAAGTLPPDRLDYAVGFREGYADRIRERRVQAALIGGVAGTAVLAAVIISAVTLTRASADDGGNGGQPPPFRVALPIRIGR